MKFTDTPSELPTKVSSLKEFLQHYDYEFATKGPRIIDVVNIKYDSTNPGKTYAPYSESRWLYALSMALNKCGIKCKPSSTYDADMEAAVKEFQSTYMKDNFWYSSDAGDKKVTPGVLDDYTITMIVSYANDMPDYINPEDGSYIGGDSGEDDSSNSPHYQPFFDKDNIKQFRQNHKNIRIIFGGSGIVKTIHDVVMRSVGVEVDTSGNPISETYEFIARDVTETDESKDTGKYENENGVSPSDIQYRFNLLD